eukprot:6211465-Pleurochrysis_carterae.AAC.7
MSTANATTCCSSTCAMFSREVSQSRLVACIAMTRLELSLMRSATHMHALEAVLPRTGTRLRQGWRLARSGG